MIKFYFIIIIKKKILVAAFVLMLIIWIALILKFNNKLIIFLKKIPDDQWACDLCLGKIDK